MTNLRLSTVDLQFSLNRCAVFFISLCDCTKEPPKYSSVWRHTAFRYTVSVLSRGINETHRDMISCKCVFGSGSVMVLSLSDSYRQVNFSSGTVTVIDLWSIEVFHPMLGVLDTPSTYKAIVLRPSRLIIQPWKVEYTQGAQI